MNRLKYFSRFLYASVAALSLLLPFASSPSLAAGAAPAESGASSTLAPLVLDSQQRLASQRIAQLMEFFHYGRIPLNDELSSKAFDRYLDYLDHQRMFFFASEVESFEPQRHRVDDLLKSGNLEPLVDIFSLYRERHIERLQFSLEVLQSDLSFDSDETILIDRNPLPWAATQEELDEVWRQRVINDALSLLLAGSEWEDAQSTLISRYERIIDQLQDFTIDNAFEAIVNSFARTLDPHSSYLSARNTEQYMMDMSQTYEGIGAVLRQDGEWTVVEEIFAGGPAAVEGTLKNGDRIIGVAQGEEGEMIDVIGWDIYDVVQLIRGSQGTGVRLLVLPAGVPPGGQSINIDLVRDQIRLEERAARSEILEFEHNGESTRIGVIAIPSFYQDHEARARGEVDYVSTTLDVFFLLLELEEEGIDGVLIDLRGNGGGHLSEATMLAALFVEPGPIVQLRDSLGQNNVVPGGIEGPLYTGPLAVLVDRYSASASEIFAAAIQDYERGPIIGQQTFGKGTVQNLFSMNQQLNTTGLGQLTLTIGKYYRVTGGSTQHRGVEPDIVLPTPIDPTLVGESSRDSALPWEQINGTQFTPNAVINSTILSLLQEYHEARAAADPNYQYLLSEVAAWEAEIRNNELSLNLETRRNEIEQYEQNRLARENARREALGLDLLETLEELAEAEIIDVQRQEAAHIVADLALLQRLSAEEIENAAAAAR